MALLIQRLLKAVGSPNYIRIPSAEETFEMANRVMSRVVSPVVSDFYQAQHEKRGVTLLLSTI